MPRISIDNYDTVASWNGSQDLFVVEQPDGTKVATPAMVKQYVLGNSIDDIYSVMGQNGAKNLIPYPYPKMSTTIRGITWSDNGDGGIVGNGTGTEASSQPYCELNGSSTNNAKDLLLKANTWYTLTCKRTSPYAIGANIYFLDPTTMQQTSITYDVIYGDSGQTTATKNNVYMSNGGIVYEEVKFKLPQDMYAQVQVRYKAGTEVTVSNDVQYPMLRLASDTDNTYQPYAKTNKELTDTIGDLSQTGLTGDSVAEQLDTAREQIAALENIKVANVSATMNVATADSKAIGGYRSVSSTSKALSTFTGYPTGKTVVATSLFAYGENAAILGVVNVINGVVYLNTAATGNYTVHGNVFYKD